MMYCVLRIAYCVLDIISVYAAKMVNQDLTIDRMTEKGMISVSRLKWVAIRNTQYAIRNTQYA